jgi:hypothetical protein
VKHIIVVSWWCAGSLLKQAAYLLGSQASGKELARNQPVPSEKERSQANEQKRRN